MGKTFTASKMMAASRFQHHFRRCPQEKRAAVERDFFREPLRILGRRISLYSRVAMRVARHGRFRSALYHLALS